MQQWRGSLRHCLFLYILGQSRFEYLRVSSSVIRPQDLPPKIENVNGPPNLAMLIKDIRHPQSVGQEAAPLL